MAINCCWGCVAPKRHPGCHGHCPEYIAEKDQLEKEKEIINQRKSIYDGLTAQSIAGVFRAKKAQKRMKGRF